MSTQFKPTLGFDRRIEAVLHLHTAGYPSHLIAHEAGTTRASVSSMLSRAGRKANRAPIYRRGSAPYAILLLAPDLVPMLRPHAARRGLSCAALAALIVDTVVASGLVDATLDDRED